MKIPKEAVLNILLKRLLFLQMFLKLSLFLLYLILLQH